MNPFGEGLSSEFSRLLFSFIQVAATSLIAVCQQIGADLTALHVLPKLKELFNELAFSQETLSSGSFGGRLKVGKTKMDEVQIDSRMDLV